jgi:diaminopimelate epimerase
MAAGRRAGAFDEEVAIALPGGTLSLCWPGAGEPLWMTGPAAVSFRGEIGD